MYKNVKLLTKSDKDLKVDVVKSFKYAKELTQCIVTVDEFFKASRSQPIVFAKNEAGEYFATAILGVEDANIFVNGKGEWSKGEYIPAYVRRYPFIFVQENNTLALAYDSECKEVNEKKGKDLFDADENSEYLNSIMKFMQEYQNSSQKSAMFIKALDELGLLEDTNANLNIDGKKFTFTGFKRVNEKKLSELSDEDKLKLIKNGSYNLIVAHLISLSNFDKLAALYK
jgi:hypothetical protein